MYEDGAKETARRRHAFFGCGQRLEKNIESLIIHCGMCVSKFYDVFCDAFGYFLV